LSFFCHHKKIWFNYETWWIYYHDLFIFHQKNGDLTMVSNRWLKWLNGCITIVIGRLKRLDFTNLISGFVWWGFHHSFSDRKTTGNMVGKLAISNSDIINPVVDIYRPIMYIVWVCVCVYAYAYVYVLYYYVYVNDYEYV
jgi:hypothetical protein